MKINIAIVLFLVAASVATYSISLVPNHYCVALFGIPCDVNQGKVR